MPPGQPPPSVDRGLREGLSALSPALPAGNWLEAPQIACVSELSKKTPGGAAGRPCARRARLGTPPELEGRQQGPAWRP